MATPAQVEAAARGVAAALAEEMGETLVSVVLFGSWARGDARPDSDVDLIIVHEYPDSWSAYQAWRRAKGRAGGGLLWGPVSLPRSEADKNLKLFLDVSQEGRILFDRGGYFAGRMDAFRARLKELGSIKVYVPNGTYYWKIKPDLKWGEQFEL